MEQNKESYEDYLNPDDISQWVSKSPIEFVTFIVPIINGKIELIASMADTLKKLPDIDTVRGDNWSPEFTVSMFLDMFIGETLKINRILRTWVVYRKYYLETHQGDDSIPE